MPNAFWGTNPNLNYAVNRLNRNSLSIWQKLVGIISGGGYHAADGKVEDAVKWLIDKVSSNRITYSTDPVGRNLKKPSGTSFDCSSFIITGFYAVGIDIDASYTGNMRKGFTSAGWKWIPGSNFPSSELQRGDILLNERNHCQMYIGGNQDVNCGSTPAMVQNHAPDNYGRGWDGVLRKI